ncbi:MAG: right-handed parallel beta-helix repeat-containing protein [Candidatus Ratteibacteria bacterium]|nr:right-handed parallel beta-helix repeat-containing protein [Candidatus Ratteibacteria bacterium]
MRVNKQWLFVIFVALVLCWANAVVAATLHVPSQYETIQAAIDATSDGDKVVVDNGIYTGEGNKNLTWDATVKHITVKSKKGPANCIIDCENSGNAFSFDETGQDATDVIEGFTIISGSAEYGGGIYCYYSSPSITDCIIEDNEADHDGGGIYCSFSSPAITDCVIEDNEAEDDGGGICCVNASSPTITNCTVGSEDEENGNYAEYDGGGIYCGEDCSPIITDCFIANNEANDDAGGGIYCGLGSSPSIINCDIEGNEAYGWEDGDAGYGGGIYCGAGSSPTITNCNIEDNEAYGLDAPGYGGGIYIFAVGEVITKTKTSNILSGTTVTNCTIAENTATDGGGICIFVEDEGMPVKTIPDPIDSFNVDITKCTIAENIAMVGGGIYITGDEEDMDEKTIPGPVDSSLNITNCAIIENIALAGGGIFCESADLAITNCTIAFNNIDMIFGSPMAEGDGISGYPASGITGGGGILADDFSSLTVKNSILWGNCYGIIDPQRKLNGEYGGQIDLLWDSYLDIDYSDIEGGQDGIYCDEDSEVNWGDNNIDEDPLFVNASEIIEHELKMRPPVSEAKEDAGYHLSKDSPCRDSGSNDGAPKDDIDGQKRPFKKVVDMGYDEYSRSCPVDTKNGDVTLSLENGAFVETDPIDEQDLPDAGKPEVPFPFGLFSLRIIDIQAGETVTVTLTLPDNVPTDAEYWKYGSTADEPTDHWYQFPFGSNDGDNIITLELTDAGDGDDNYDEADSEIWDPGGISMVIEEPGDDEDKNSCFLATILGVSRAKEEIMLVRRFRDEKLATNPAGRLFVSTYYRVSPSLADFIRGYPALINTAREMLMPVIWVMKQFEN